MEPNFPLLQPQFYGILNVVENEPCQLRDSLCRMHSLAILIVCCDMSD